MPKSFSLHKSRSKQCPTQQRVIDSSCPFSFYGYSFLLWFVFPFMFFLYTVFVIDNTCYRFFDNFVLRCYNQVATIFTFVWICLINYCSTGVSELCPILILCQIKPYLNILPNFILSYYITGLLPLILQWAEQYPITELYPNLLQFWSTPYLNTLSNYTLSKQITEL